MERHEYHVKLHMRGVKEDRPSGTVMTRSTPSSSPTSPTASLPGHSGHPPEHVSAPAYESYRALRTGPKPIGILTASKEVQQYLTALSRRINRVWAQHGPPRHRPLPLPLVQLMAENKRGVIQVCQADKNMGLVVVSTSQLQVSLCKLLSDKDTYQRIDVDRTPYLQHLVNNLASFTRSLILSRQERDCIDHYMNGNAQLPCLIPLIKVHKLKGGTMLDERAALPIRPVISASNSITTGLARVLVHRLTRARTLAQFPWILRDRQQLMKALQGITGTITKNTYILTGDVNDMYPRLRTSDCLSYLPHPAYADWIAELAAGRLFITQDTQDTTVLYRQCKGLSMGSNESPVLANLCMLPYDLDLLSARPPLRLYARYLDDIILIADAPLQPPSYLRRTPDEVFDLDTPPGTGQLATPHTSLHLDTLSITWNRHDWRSCDFLDLTIRIQPIQEARRVVTTIHPNEHHHHQDRASPPIQEQEQEYEIVTSLYRKPTHRGLHLPFGSYHSLPTLTSWVRNEIHRITSCFVGGRATTSAYLARRQFVLALRARGYPQSFFDLLQSQARLSTSRKTKTTNASPPAVVAFIIRLCPIVRRLQIPRLLRMNSRPRNHTLPICFPKSKSTKDQFKRSYRPIMAYRRSRNLATLLIPRPPRVRFPVPPPSQSHPTRRKKRSAPSSHQTSMKRFLKRARSKW